MFCIKAFSSLAFLFIFCIFQTVSGGFECRHDNVDLSALNGTWISWTDDSVNESISYRINLCSPLLPNGADDHSCPTGASVCMIFSNGTTYSAGNFNASADSLAGGTNEELGESWIVLAGDKCPADPSYNLTTSINMKCGPTIGSPVFLDFTLCVSYFEWETDLYCKTRSTVKEVPCYMYDDKGNRYDLSPLAKTKGGYLVSSEDESTDIFINVCRDINPVDSLTTGCPAGSASCRKTGSETIGLGEVVGGLQRGSGGRLILRYESSRSESMAGCTSKPATTIIFLCPERGASKFPTVISDFDCQYVIEWETEYACPDTKLFNDTCVLTKEEADIDIDLRPLKKTPGLHTHCSCMVADKMQNESCCWENEVGEEVFKVILVDLGLLIAVGILFHLHRALWAKCTCKLIGYSKFDVVSSVLDVVYGQCLVWLGLYFSPLLAAISVVKLVMVFYFRYLVAKVSMVPPQQLFRASSTGNFYLAILLLNLFISLFPMAYAVIEFTPLVDCGPFSGYDRPYRVISELVGELPNWLEDALTYLGTPAVFVPILILMIMLVVYFKVKSSSYKRLIRELRRQLKFERKVEKRKIFATGRAMSGGALSRYTSQESLATPVLRHRNMSQHTDTTIIEEEQDF